MPPRSRKISFNTSQIFSRVRRFCNDERLLLFIGTRPQGDEFYELINIFRRYIPADEEVLAQSLIDLVGVEISDSLLKMAAWRLAANHSRLKAGQPVPPWSRQRENEWVLVQIYGARRWVTRRGKTGGMLLFRILTGSAAGLSVEKFWSTGFCGTLSRRMGFTSAYTRNGHPFQHVGQLVGMQIPVQLQKTRHNAPDFDIVSQEVPASIITKNRKLLTARGPMRECPKGYSYDVVKCHLCPVGMDSCPLATHVATFHHQRCPRCRRRKLFDPASDTRICVDCSYLRLVDNAKSQGSN